MHESRGLGDVYKRQQLFLHRLNLETIEAEGAAAAQLAEAIALAQQRIVILERQTR